MPKPANFCTICGKKSRAHNLCTLHYMRLRRNPNGVPELKGRGIKTKHPLYEKWRHTATSPQGRDERWDVLEAFLLDIGNPLESDYTLERIDTSKPFGPSNFKWQEPLRLTVNSITDPSAYGKEWRKRNPDKTKHKYLRNNYGINLVDYTTMLTAQGGVCFICKQAETETYKGKLIDLAVDHCHTTGKNRGLLCSKCNTALGSFRDTPEIMEAGAAYVRKWQELHKCA